MSVIAIYERSSSPIADVFKFLTTYQQDSSKVFCDTLSSQLANVFDDDFVLIEKSPFCTHVIDASQDLQSALSEYYTDEQRQFSGFWGDAAVIPGKQYKEWCESNIDKLIEWDTLADKTNGLLALGFDEDSPELKTVNEDYNSYKSMLLNDLCHEAVYPLAPSTSSHVTPVFHQKIS